KVGAGDVWDARRRGYLWCAHRLSCACPPTSDSECLCRDYRKSCPVCDDLGASLEVQDSCSFHRGPDLLLGSRVRPVPAQQKESVFMAAPGQAHLAYPVKTWKR